MERNHMQPPSYAQSRDSSEPDLPIVPAAEAPHVHYDRTLPPPPAIPAAPRPPAQSWPSMNPYVAMYQEDLARASPRNSPPVESRLDNRGRGSGSAVSVDDKERIALEALGNLKDISIHSPPQHHTSLPPLSPRNFQEGQPEPLLSLLTTSYPIIKPLSNNAISAYNAGKNYIPGFKTSVEYVVEGPADKVGKLSRVTGLEGKVRWFLKRRPSHHKPSDLEATVGSSKRRKMTPDERMKDRDVPHEPYSTRREPLVHRPRTPSQVSIETLPAYDDHKSPPYESAPQQALVTTRNNEPTSPSSWPTRLVLSTSALSVSMSESSLRRLKDCLRFLKYANEQIGNLLQRLISLLEQFDRDSETASRSNELNYSNGRDKSGQLIVRGNNRSSALSEEATKLKSELVRIVKSVVENVGKYTAGVLPENATALVRSNLAGLPRRFMMAYKPPTNAIGGESAAAGSEKEARASANTAIVLAQEALDMMAQVSGIVDDTITSAEEWCEKLYRKKREEGEMSPPPQPTTNSSGGYFFEPMDIKTGPIDQASSNLVADPMHLKTR
ncbi:transcription factor Opi1-domain-containing protein [Bisporella sp. PMI_857]|nr:transcription factor Opi1-domain-containing protein [Bisporella sp. PMI_857]